MSRLPLLVCGCVIAAHCGSPADRFPEAVDCLCPAHRYERARQLSDALLREADVSIAPNSCTAIPSPSSTEVVATAPVSSCTTAPCPVTDDLCRPHPEHATCPSQSAEKPKGVDRP
jgi:hypothetical protein